MTGSGKTEILKKLSDLGENVIDLEGLANHKGSAFGFLGQDEQPTNEQFENDLAQLWMKLDQSGHVWLEDESRNIGKVIIPDVLFERMISGRLFLINIPFYGRVKKLAEEYGRFERKDLLALINKIGRRMGGDKAKRAAENLENGNLEKAVSEVLHYYDKTYQYGLSKRDRNKIISLKPKQTDPVHLALEIVNSFSLEP